MQVAHDEKIERLFATILGQNLEMQKIAQNLGFKLTRSLTDSDVQASVDLGHPAMQAILG
jgi:acetyltransferase